MGQAKRVLSELTEIIMTCRKYGMRHRDIITILDISHPTLNTTWKDISDIVKVELEENGGEIMKF